MAESEVEPGKAPREAGFTGTPEAWRITDPRWSRRDFLRTSSLAAAGLAAGPLLAACGGSGSSTAASPAPAGAIPKPRPGAKIQLLQWNSFVPAADEEIRRQAKAFSDANNVEVTIQTVTGDQLQPKTAAAVEAGSGPDIIQMQYGWPHLYDTACLDVGDVVAILKDKLGAINQVNDAFCKVNGKYLAVPYAQVPNAWTYRTDLWQQAGFTSFFKTWDELAADGKQLKSKNLPPIAVSLGHAYGDAITMWYPVLWDFGGREVSSDGKHVTISSKETESALKWAIDTWKNGYISQNTLSWLDPDNNQAYHSGLITATLNGASIYIKEVYTTATNHKFAAVSDNADQAKSATSAATLNLIFNHAVMKWTQEADTAKAFILYLMDQANYTSWLNASVGYNGGPFKALSTADIFQKDTKLKPFLDVIGQGRWPGWPAQPSKATAQSQVQFVIVDMFAKAVTSGDAKGAIADAEQKLKRIYELPS
jgi:ABC-type glycerol-3-phosphate transport system substrate-binding protein